MSSTYLEADASMVGPPSEIDYESNKNEDDYHGDWKRSRYQMCTTIFTRAWHTFDDGEEEFGYGLKH